MVRRWVGGAPDRVVSVDGRVTGCNERVPKLDVFEPEARARGRRDLSVMPPPRSRFGLKRSPPPPPPPHKWGQGLQPARAGLILFHQALVSVFLSLLPELVRRGLGFRGPL